jgi:hypothetical protein
MRIQKEIKIDDVTISELRLHNNAYQKHVFPRMRYADPTKYLYSGVHDIKVKIVKCIQVIAESKEVGNGYHRIEIIVAPFPGKFDNLKTLLKAQVAAKKMTKTILNSYITVAMTRMEIK